MTCNYTLRKLVVTDGLTSDHFALCMILVVVPRINFSIELAKICKLMEILIPLFSDFSTTCLNNSHHVS
jgi:hypothetical protein